MRLMYCTCTFSVLPLVPSAKYIDTLTRLPIGASRDSERQPLASPTIHYNLFRSAIVISPTFRVPVASCTCISVEELERQIAHLTRLLKNRD